MTTPRPKARAPKPRRRWVKAPMTAVCTKSVGDMDCGERAVVVCIDRECDAPCGCSQAGHLCDGRAGRCKKHLGRKAGR